MPRRSSSSPILILLLLLLPILALLVFFLTLRSFLAPAPPSHSHKLRSSSTNGVKSSWDSLNAFLVLFAILCGIFARKNNDEPTATAGNGAGDDHHSNDNIVVSNGHTVSQLHNKLQQLPQAPSDSIIHQWSVDDQKIYADNSLFSTRLKRSSSSYPDLRHPTFWEPADHDRFRFFDDFDLGVNHRNPSPIHHPRGIRFEESSVKEIPVDAFQLRSSPSPPQKSPPPPPPPPTRTTASHRKQKRAYRTVPGNVGKTSESGYEFKKTKTPPPTPPPPPPLQIAPPAASPRKQSKSKYKKPNATKEIKMVLASLYKKRKNKQQTRVSHDDGTLCSPTEPPSFGRPPPSPPPPPPRPPPPLLHSLFRKNIKNKRIHSFLAPPQPPPPPPPPPPQSKRSSRHKGQVPLSPESPRTQKSTTAELQSSSTGSDNLYEDNMSRREQPPAIPMPPPPPPPPFKVPGFQFVTVGGDFVKIRSAQSSRCSSPDLRKVDKELKETMKRMDGNSGPVFCPSPDVDMKADSFITRLRDGWRLEKLNSLREKGSVD